MAIGFTRLSCPIEVCADMGHIAVRRDTRELAPRGRRAEGAEEAERHRLAGIGSARIYPRLNSRSALQEDSAPLALPGDFYRQQQRR